MRPQPAAGLAEQTLERGSLSLMTTALRDVHRTVEGASGPFGRKEVLRAGGRSIHRCGKAAGYVPKRHVPGPSEVGAVAPPSNGDALQNVSRETFDASLSVTLTCARSPAHSSSLLVRIRCSLIAALLWPASVPGAIKHSACDDRVDSRLHHLPSQPCTGVGVHYPELFHVKQCEIGVGVAPSGWAANVSRETMSLRALAGLGWPHFNAPALCQTGFGRVSVQSVILKCFT